MVRFMAMEESGQMARVRLYYYSWYAGFSVLAIGAGLAARLLLPGGEGFDTELALPMLSIQILPEVLVGLVLAGLFAATMSTADSQILSCTAAVTRDLPNGKQVPYWLTKAATIFITALALIIALYGPDSVFTLVVIAWAALAAAFGPLLIVYCLGGRPNELLAIAMMLAGLAAIWGWRTLGYNAGLYEVLPGIAAGLAVYGIGHIIGLRLPKAD
jgi:Na+/proline symporter